MTDKITERFHQFQTPLWTLEQFKQWYDLDESDESTQKVLKQIQIFAGTEGEPSEFGTNPFNHWHFELALQRWDYVPVRQAAAELAMDVKTFRQVIEKFNESELGVFVAASPQATDSFVRRTFLRDFHKGFKSLRRIVFSSHDTYISRLHAAIQKDLNVDIQTILDPIDKRPCHKVDCLTDEPVAIGNEVYLSTGKPIQLTPDCCSVYTYQDNEDSLRDHLLGLPPDEATLERLRRKQSE